MINKDGIKARLGAAMPGPWKVGYSMDIESLGRSIDAADDCVIEPNIFLAMDDADFIAHAPTDIADLLAEVERLESELAKFKKCENHYDGSLPCGGAECWHKDEE